MSVSTPKGITPSVRHVSRPTLEKRIRRKLAERGHYLQKSRIGTDARQELGEYSVLDDRFVPLSTHCKLTDLARFLGVMTDQESIEADHRWNFIGIDLVNGMAIKTRHYFEVKATTEPDQHDIDGLTGNDLDGQVEALLRLASDWRQVSGTDGKPMDFNRANVRLMLDNFPNAGRAISEVLKGGRDTETSETPVGAERVEYTYGTYYPEEGPEIFVVMSMFVNADGTKRYGDILGRYTTKAEAITALKGLNAKGGTPNA